MYPAPTSTPTPDATPVPIGRRIAFRWAFGGVVSAALALLGAFLATRAVVDTTHVRAPLATFGRSAFLLLLCGTLAFICLRMAERHRRLTISTDYAGLWLIDGDAHAVIAWNDVAAIGLHQYSITGATSPNLTYTSWSIDLRLHEPMDPGDPLLDRMVLPADPPRYMIRLPRGTHVDTMAAIRARVPELWLEAPETD